MIIYHKIDMDGFFSGAIASFETGDQVLIGADYHVADKVIQKIRDMSPKKLVIVDFSFKEKEFNQVLDLVPDTIWIDHHKTAIKEAGDRANALPGIRKDDNQSAACWLTAEHFNALEKYDNYLLKLASDYDVFNFDNKNPLKAIPAMFNFGFMSRRDFPNEMVTRAKRFLRDPTLVEDALTIGETLMIEALGTDESVSRMAMFGEYRGYTYALVNCTSSPNFLINKFENKDMMITWSVGSEEKVKMNFRSHKGGKCDVSELASALGGGGHENAAGATVDMNDFVCTFLGADEIARVSDAPERSVLVTRYTGLHNERRSTILKGHV